MSKGDSFVGAPLYIGHVIPKLFPVLICLVIPMRANAQTTGSIVGRVRAATTGEALPGVELRLTGLPHHTVTAADGRFVLGAIPAGERELRIAFLGYKTVVLQALRVEGGRATEIDVSLESAPVEVAPLIVRADRARLVEPEVSTTHEVVVGRELRALPVDDIGEVIELTTGVSGGHFRGGRIGQEAYVIDGLTLKNQLEASQEGSALELSPTSLDEVNVMTGGFGAQFGSALSGVVSYTTRRGSSAAWAGSAALVGDRFLPESLLTGFTGLNVSAGGPLRFLGNGATLFTDVALQAKLDADPRSRGLTCLQEGDVEAPLAARIRELQSSPGAAALYCPYTRSLVPHQRGDKYIAFARFDKPLTAHLQMSVSLLRNRAQNELYTSEFKYHPANQLGQRFTGTLATTSLEWLRNHAGGATSISLKGGLLRLDRYLGAVDPASFDGASFAGFHPSAFAFIGEEFARKPITEQIALGSAIPGYAAPSTTAITPYGLAAAGIFYTAGTPSIASWSRSDLATMNLTAARFTPRGGMFSGGATASLYHVEAYERSLAHLAGSMPSYARFYPATVATFGNASLKTDDDLTFNAGLRIEAFRSGVSYQEDRADFVSPIIETAWKLSVMPRFGVGIPVPGTSRLTAIRVSYSRIAQPPDFRYFVDSSVGDSLRTDIQRQGNPNLSFESGATYELGVSQLFNDRIALGITTYRKDLNSLVSAGSRQYRTDDFGNVTGVELTLRVRTGITSARASWVVQKAVGRSSGVENDSTHFTDADARTETPLAFDRRHTVDFALLFGRAVNSDAPWSLSLTTTAQSGYPLFRSASSGAARVVARYLPWTSSTDMRGTWEFGSFLCGTCRWRARFDARNLLGRKDVLGLRRDTETLAPSLADVERLADSQPLPRAPIPMESPIYTKAVDGDGDGVITTSELRLARFAAVLDRYDPTVFFGRRRELRFGLEMSF